MTYENITMKDKIFGTIKEYWLYNWKVIFTKRTQMIETIVNTIEFLNNIFLYSDFFKKKLYVHLPNRIYKK